MRDPIRLEILRHAFAAAAEEMKINLARTAYNPIIYEVLDFSCGIFDRRCRIVAQADGLPGFLGHLGVAVSCVVEDVGADAMRPGDLYLINDPYAQGTHINDVTTVEPVFHEDELVGYVATRAHWLDIGATDPGGSITITDIVQEGLWLRSVRLYEEGRLNESVWRIIEHNVRYTENMLGDLRAQIASSRTGAQRVGEIHARHGSELVEQATETMMRQGEQRVRAAISRMHDGVYEARAQLDDDCLGNGPLDVRVRATVAGDSVEIDFEGTGPMNRGPVNAPYPAVLCCCRVALKGLTTPEVAAVEGDFVPLTVKVPKGSMVAAEYPAPTFIIASLLILLMDLVRHVLTQALPERTMGGHYGAMSAYTMFGDDPATGKLYIQQEPMSGGWGATRERDGESGLIFIANGDCRAVSAESMESRFPLRMERYALWPDSGGAGRWRGGLGTIREIRPLRHATNLMAINDRKLDPPWGVDGGAPGTRTLALLSADGAEPAEIGKVQGHPVPEGTLVSFRSGGGGGCGDPRERDLALVQRDVTAGYVTVEGARRDYGVVVDPETLAIDVAATEELRRAAEVAGR